MARKDKKSSGGVLRSMTGFGMAACGDKDVAIEVELKTANSRYLDLIFRLPRMFNQYEAELRAELVKSVERGRVEISVSRTTKRQQPMDVQFNAEAFRSLSEIYKKAGRDLGASPAEIKSAILTQVLSRHEVLFVQEQPLLVKKELVLLLSALRDAVSALNKMREREGNHLETDMRSRLGTLTEIKQDIAGIVARKPELARDRLLAAVKRISGDIQLDESRLHTEVALLADRSDVTEELVRLESHLKHFSELLRTGPVGKKLDFLVQELLREFNTIGSKAQDHEVQKRVVDAKSELEKIREQVQNLE